MKIILTESQYSKLLNDDIINAEDIDETCMPPTPNDTLTNIIVNLPNTPKNPRLIFLYLLTPQGRSFISKRFLTRREFML